MSPAAACPDWQQQLPPLPPPGAASSLLLPYLGFAFHNSSSWNWKRLCKRWQPCLGITLKLLPERQGTLYQETSAVTDITGRRSATPQWGLNSVEPSAGNLCWEWSPLAAPCTAAVYKGCVLRQSCHHASDSALVLRNGFSTSQLSQAPARSHPSF